ncbi:U32 family peptidase [uncultured Ruminococcus sp.]|uniref:peptidase U32 family protein n=1 Tax=uncultured Ruminococcus sp. TaxID=165186 RepID=UPI002614B039|nr:U32 family peptidase [uncultured Ruminococcus sp.]
MRTPEILAPAGAPESLLAALRCGADAVYVGGKSFSARQNAENFDLPQLEEAARLCHLYGAKLYLTVNTLVLDEEFPALTQYIKEAAACGVDAFLVQDFGVLDCIRQAAPDTPIHASTQMTIHTPEGARWAKEQGLTRVVVSRELSRQEIAAICQCDIEVEQFVHGALCMSVSGQCGLSAVIGSRSANRGRCAQACRLPFSAAGKTDACALSLKDLCLVPYVAQMAEDGVASLKIEGRCKRPEYVAAAVTALVQARDGIEPDLETLRAVFSRSGFTDGYYTGKRGSMFGTRQKEDVLRAKEVLPKLEQLYQKPVGRVPLTMHVLLKENVPVQLTARDMDGNTVTVSGDMPQKARNKPTDTTQLERQMGKLGDTIYFLEQLTADCDGVSMLPASALNALRRDCTAKLDEVRIAANTPRCTLCDVEPILEQPVDSAPPFYRIQLSGWTEQAESLLQHLSTEALLLPVYAVTDSIPQQLRGQIFLTLPRFCADEKKVLHWLESAAAFGFSHLVCENPSHLRMGTSLGFCLHGGLGLNAANRRCLDFLKRQGLADTILSPELTLAQTRGCTGLPIGVYAYGYQQVMTMRNCPIQAEVGCKNCNHRLTDRTGRQFPVYCDKNAGITTMYNAVPTWMADKANALSHAAFLLLDCTLQPDPLSILRAYENRSTATEPITRGLFYRGVE